MYKFKIPDQTEKSMRKMHRRPSCLRTWHPLDCANGWQMFEILPASETACLAKQQNQRGKHTERANKRSLGQKCVAACPEREEAQTGRQRQSREQGWKTRGWVTEAEGHGGPEQGWDSGLRSTFSVEAQRTMCLAWTQPGGICSTRLCTCIMQVRPLFLSTPLFIWFVCLFALWSFSFLSQYLSLELMTLVSMTSKIHRRRILFWNLGSTPHLSFDGM